ncbi:DUF1453 domain-containing protein [Xanthomonas sp. A2111]|uniref:DUF1453 domain-containing protein n=1 Tax=Xanthomonas hawaiiensis TaxID=3003247 RepID=A0ABU2I3E1_9XANT|nr:DUF1453 domain-containing protein [Xanthomonas sp. A2111]MBO9828910.1 DUF1453 domain-containing protein [Xanthomonas sp. A2111]MDS9992670.1 DUF1453 domain-containing protein [Xanthomonas sp. A2111]
MPLLLAIPLAIVIALAVTAVLLPLSLLQRFRVGTARRQARGWLVAVQLWSALLSSGMLLVFAVIAGHWWPDAAMYALAGWCCGVLLGALGIGVTRFEPLPHGLHYTPNLWLALGLTALVAVRIGAGLWQGWRSLVDGAAWPTQGWMSHASLLAAAALLLGYACAYAWLLRRRLRHFDRYRGFDRSPR